MKKLCAALATITVLLLAATAGAGVIAPALESQMQALGGDGEVKVLVVLSDQADITVLNQQLREGGVTRQHRHETVVDALQTAARRSQAPLVEHLESRQREGSIRGFTQHWLVNAVVVVGEVDAIRELALRDDVIAIEPNLEVELIEPIKDDKPVPPGGHRGIGITPGLEAIDAPRVWNELGIDGTGVVVGIMDTGVDGTHPALADRWRGLFADPSACWLDNSGQGTPDFPVDNHYHGTHVMGTVTGLAPGDTIGVAPGALWIASNTINQGVGSEFDNDVIASLEWFADPDGDPQTVDDVPCVVQNSWGTYTGLGYPECFSYWWTAIDNCEAAGVVLTWSAGNEGPYDQSLRSPADRADSPYNAFSVGSTHHYSPYPISDFSSRGPSGCGSGQYSIKPEVCAPGSDIYSAQPGGGYQYLDGTSMAGPHVAGVVALMYSANPNLDVETTKQILMDTCVDLGTTGEDNTYGHGIVNAYEAVIAVMGGLGTVSGTVTDAGTGLPIEGVEIGVVDRPVSRMTDENGQFEFMLPVDAWTLTFDGFGYGPETLVVDVLENETVDGSVAMTALPTALLSGVVYDFEGATVDGATIRVIDTPLDPVTSAPDGSYSIAMPAGAVYDVVARATGYGADQHTVDFQTNTTLDFTLPELTAEDFESATFLLYPWEMSGNADWVIDSAAPYEGFYSARSGDVGDNQSSTLEVTVEVTASDDISFWYKVSSETNYDYLRFSIDGVEIASWSGEEPWSQYSYPVDAGTRTFKWSFTKDQSVSSGSDAGWVDFIEFPTLGEIPYPSATVDPASIEQTVVEGETALSSIMLGNEGEADLTYQVSIQYPARGEAPVATAPVHELEKGERDQYTGDVPVTGSGGPDAFGYSWIDSDEVGGPTYGWVEISGIGTVVGGDDDANLGPFPLGFSFPFYGQTYSSIRVCTNGWLSFTSTAETYTNQSIPNTSDPNSLLAPFWDDLNPSAGGVIYYYADSANDRFIVQWDAVEHYPSGSPETFQVILNADGSIVYQYETVALGNSCTVGIESPDGTDGLQALYNASGYLHNGLAIRFAVAPETSWLSVSPTVGSVSPEMCERLDLTFDATELETGEYYAEVSVATDDPDNPVHVVPVTMTVTSETGVEDEVVASTVRFLGAVPNPFNPTTGLHFVLPQAADVELRIYDVAGHLVRTVVSGRMPAGENRVSWDGRDDGGHGVASGTYFARLVVGDEALTTSLTLLR